MMLPLRSPILLVQCSSMLSQSDQGCVGQAPMLLALAPSLWPIFLPGISPRRKSSSQAHTSPLAKSSAQHAYSYVRSIAAWEAGLMGYCQLFVVSLLPADEVLLC